jgi:hypothetical protein
MAALVERLNRRIADTTATLLRLHRLDPGEAGRINARVREHFAVRAPLDKAQAGLLGAVVSGAATGLSADLMAGGLTLGGGALLGAIVGALTMAGAAWGFNTTTDREHPTVQFADPFLRTLMVGAVLRYLAVAHFGRGRGNFVEGEAPAFWQAEVEAVVARREAELAGLWKAVRTAADESTAARLVEEVLTPVVTDTLDGCTRSRRHARWRAIPCDTSPAAVRTRPDGRQPRAEAIVARDGVQLLKERPRTGIGRSCRATQLRPGAGS